MFRGMEVKVKDIVKSKCGEGNVQVVGKHKNSKVLRGQEIERMERPIYTLDEILVKHMLRHFS